MNSMAYFNGHWQPLSEVAVSPLDRGFLFGDGAYEVIPTYQGFPFLQQAHLERLAYSLEQLSIVAPLTSQAWTDVFQRLLSYAAEGQAVGIYLQVTRGAAEHRTHAYAKEMKPNVFSYCFPAMDYGYNAADYAGHRALTAPDLRWQRCDIKSIQLLANTMAQQKAKDEGADETILLREGKAVEATSSNLFIVKEGVVMTPPLDNILSGVTRKAVLDVLQKEGIPFKEQVISEALLRQADEVWLTASGKDIMPITVLDGEPVGTGMLGALWRSVGVAFEKYKQDYLTQYYL